VFPEVNAAIHFCYVCYVAILWPFKIASIFWNCYVANRFLFLDFRFCMCAIQFCNGRFHMNAAIAKVNVRS